MPGNSSIISKSYHHNTLSTYTKDRETNKETYVKYSKYYIEVTKYLLSKQRSSNCESQLKKSTYCPLLCESGTEHTPQ